MATPRNAAGACVLWQLLTSSLSWEVRARRHISGCHYEHLNPPKYLLTFIHILPVLGSASKGLSNVQFGSIDDNSAPPSTSPAAPSTLTDPKQVRTFGSISATPKPPTASASPTVTKPAVSLPGSSSTAASSAGPTVKKKLDIHKLFQQPSGATSETAPPTAPSTPIAPATPQDSIPPRPPALQSNTFEPANARNSPSVRNTPLPSQGGQPAGPPQSGSIYPPPHLRQPNGIGSPRSSNFNRGLSNNGSHRGPPGTQPGVVGSPRMVPPPTPQQPMPPPPNMPMPNGMPNGPPVGAPHGPGQVPQPMPGQAPHGMGMQGMPPPMMQWSPHYPIVSGLTVNPNPYSPSFTVLLIPLRRQRTSTILAKPTTAPHPASTSNSTYSTANSDAAPSCASHSFPVSRTNLSTAFSCYKPQSHRPSNSLNPFNAYAHHHR